MKDKEYQDAFMEGVRLSGGTVNQAIFNLLSSVCAYREQVAHLQETIGGMNDIARDCGWSVECRSCKESFEPDCELSEMVGSEYYCGKSEWCCP